MPEPVILDAAGGSQALGPASASPLLAALFPPGVAAAELRSPADPALLLAEELAHAGRFAPKRLLEYAAGRLCARRALADLDIRGFALCPQPDRRPSWPAGIVGSISHTEGFCGAVVARDRSCRGLGLDIERIARVTEEIWSRILTEQERAHIQALPAPARQPAAALVFSGKEAFYKCYGAEAGRWIEFQDVEVKLAGVVGQEGAFAIEARGDFSLPISVAARLHGRYRFHEGLVTTGMGLLAGKEPAAEG